ncbi:MAG: DUF5668 domain-containing protein [Candidatus Caldatribacteriota bacterium]|nr:DUF5668 domain-containing protein [Candidatus Caldatribacteriota bacterium]
MSTREEGRGNWLFGLILLLIGVIFIVENFTDMEVWDKLWKFWPVILLIWGIKEIFQNKSVFFGIILIAIGTVFLAQYFFAFVLSESIWKFWPVLIIALGIDQIFKSFGIDRVGHRKNKGNKGKVQEEI